jgi:hypothetical protein
MGICTDKSVEHLKSLNLNTILQPQEDIVPLQLLGEYKGARGIIGTLDQLVEQPGGTLPQVTPSAAANINGRKSSRLPLSLGLNVLGNVLGAMGGNIGVAASYASARNVEFTYDEVTRHRANTISIGDYLASAAIRWDHPILKKYLFGAGNLYVLTEVVTSRRIGVTAYRSDSTALKLDVPVIQAVVGGSVSVRSESESSSTVTYEGSRDLAFGFMAIELSAGTRGDDDEIDLAFRPVKAGSASFSVTGGGAAALVFADFEGALRGLEHVEADALGER